MGRPARSSSRTTGLRRWAVVAAGMAVLVLVLVWLSGQVCTSLILMVIVCALVLLLRFAWVKTHASRSEMTRTTLGWESNVMPEGDTSRALGAGGRLQAPSEGHQGVPHHSGKPQPSRATVFYSTEGGVAVTEETAPMPAIPQTRSPLTDQVELRVAPPWGSRRSDGEPTLEARHAAVELERISGVLGSSHPSLAAGFISIDGIGAWGASRRGRSHEQEDGLREDAFAMRSTADGLVVAVADGVGSTPDAHRAAEAAAGACVSLPWPVERLDKSGWDARAAEALDRIQIALGQAVPQARRGSPEPRPSTTLVGAVLHRLAAGNTRVFWFSVGDSSLIRLRRSTLGNPSIETLNDAPHSLATETAAMPKDRLDFESGVCDINLAKEFLMLATDGLAKPLNQDPQLYIEDFDKIAKSGADAGYLLASIANDGPGFYDDATAVLVTMLGDVI